MKRIGILVAAALGIVVGATGTVRAADMPCKDVAAKLCPGVNPGDTAYDNCLLQHKPDLPPDCQKAVDAAQARLNTLEQFPDCVRDAKQMCPDFKPGISRIMECLRVHMSDVSEECKREIGKRTGKY